MKSLEEILGLVGENAELATSIKELVDHEKQVGIKSYQKKDAEVLKYKTALKDLGYNKENYDGVESFLDAKKKEMGEIKNKDVSIAEMATRLDSMQTQLEAERAAVVAEKEMAKKEKLRAKLAEELGSKVHGSKFVVNGLINDGTVDYKDGAFVYRNGDTELSLKDGLTKFMEENQDIVKVDSTSGAGTTKGTSNTGEKTETTMAERMKALSKKR